MKNKHVFIIKTILIISLPILLLFLSLHIATNDLNFYHDKYQEYNIPQVTGMSQEGLLEVTNELLEYLKGERDDIIVYEEIKGQTRQVFGERELLHLKDVQNLFGKSYLLRNIFAIFSLVTVVYLYLYNKKALSKGLIYSSLIPVLVMIILAAIISINFYKSFTIFHEILFTNDLWLLDPKTEVLIQMYPLDFFKSIALRIFSYFVSGLIALLCLGVFVRLKIKKSS